MPIYSVQGPDGRIYDVEGPAGASEEQIIAVIRGQLPKAPAQPAQDTTGFKAAAAAGFERLKGETALTAGKLGLMDTAAAEQYQKQKEAAAQQRFTPTQDGWTESPWQKFKETAGGSVPYVAAPVAAAGLGALAATGVGAPAAAALAAGAGAFGASAGQFTGSNLSAQMDTGKTLEQTSLGAAVGAAIPQAALDTAAMALMPGVGKLFGSVGSKLTTAQAEAIAKQTLSKAAADYAAKTGTAMTREGFTETVQQVMERLQAGTSLTDEDARKEYIDSFIGGAVLGGVAAPVGRYVERGAAKTQAQEAQQARMREQRKVADEEAKVLAAEEEAYKQTDKYALDVEQKYQAAEQQKAVLKAQIKKPAQGEKLNEADKAFNADINTQLKELQPTVKELGQEFNRTAKVREQAKEQQRVAGMDPFDYMMEQTGAVPTYKPSKPGTLPEVDMEGIPGAASEQPTATQESVQALNTYAADRVQLAQEQLINPTPKELVDYLMQDPTMADQMVKTRTKTPNLPRKENELVLEGLKLRLKDVAKGAKQEAETRAENIQAGMAGAAPGSELMGAAREMPGVQSAAQERAVEDVRIGKVFPETEALRRISEKPPAFVRQDDTLPLRVDALVDSTLPSSNISGRVVSGTTVDTATEADTLRAQLAYANVTDNRERANELKKRLADMNEPDTEAAAGDLDFGARAKRAGIEGTLSKAAMQANRTTRLSNSQLSAYDKLADFVQRVRESDQDISDARKQTLTDVAERLKETVVGGALNEIDARRAQAQLPELPTAEKVKIVGQLNATLGELVERGAGIFQKPVEQKAQVRGTKTVVSAGEDQGQPVGRRVFNNFEAAAKALRGQMRDTLDTLGGFEPKEAAPRIERKVQRATPELRRQWQVASERELGQQFVAAYDRAKSDEDYRTLKDIEAKFSKLSEAAQDEAIVQVRRVENGLSLEVRGALKEELIDLRAAGLSETGQAELFAGDSEKASTRTTPKRFLAFLDSGKVQGLRFKLAEENRVLAFQEKRAATIAQKVAEENARTEATVQKILASNARSPVEKAKDALSRLVGPESKVTQALQMSSEIKTQREAARTRLRTMLNQIEDAESRAQKQVDDIQELLNYTNNKLTEVNAESGSGVAPSMNDLAVWTQARDNQLGELKKAQKVLGAVQKSLKAALNTQARVIEDHASDTLGNSIIREGAKAQRKYDAAKAALEKAEAEEREALRVLRAEPKKPAEAKKTTEEQVLGRLGPAAKVVGVERVYRDTSDANVQALVADERKNIAAAEAAHDAAKEAGNKLAMENALRRIETAYNKVYNILNNAPLRRETQLSDAEVKNQEAFDRAQASAVEANLRLFEEQAGVRPLKMTGRRTIASVRNVKSNRIETQIKQESVAAQEARVKQEEATGVYPAKALEELAKARAARAEAQRQIDYIDANPAAPRSEAKQRQTAARAAAVAKRKALGAQLKSLVAAQREVVAEARLDNKAVKKLRSERQKMVRSAGRLQEAIGEDSALYRVSTTAGKGTTPQRLAAIIKRMTGDWKNVPNIVMAETFDALPADLQAQAIADDVADFVPGMYNPNDNTVYLVAENLHSDEDIYATVSHEIAGHYGLRAMLGGEYTATMDSIYDGNADVREKAKAKMGRIPSLSQQTATEEVLADMAENAPAEPKGALRQLYDAIKKWFRETLGFDAMPDKALKQIVENARKYVIEGTGGKAGSAPKTKSLYNAKEPKFASDALADAGSVSRKVIAGQRGWSDAIKEEGLGMGLATRLVDRFAPLEKASKLMDSLNGTQMMYYARMFDQKMHFLSQAVSNGAIGLEKKTRADGRAEWLVESKEGASIKGVVDILKGAKDLVGSADGASQLFSLYTVAKRAERVGLKKMNFGDAVTQADLNRAMKAIDETPGLAKIFADARDEYNAFNKGMVQFAVDTGALRKEVAAKMLQSDDYVPFYRERDGGVEMVLGNETIAKIGNLKNQPYLKELVGGDERIIDFMTSSVQNANMLTDMALRNLSTKSAAFELRDIGMAKIGKGTASGTDVVNFKDGGEDYHAVIDTTGAGFPAELLVKGMEGIPYQTTWLTKGMGAFSNVLRKAVTLNPAYAARQLFRDSLAAPLLSGANFTPIMGALKEINGIANKTLERRGITGGQVFTGTQEDLTDTLRRLNAGESGWLKGLAKLEALSMEADALSRRAQYNSYIQQGLSEMEATYMALESMNFSKRGSSPAMHFLSTVIPFFNAQIQGLNVLFKAFTGDMPFNEKLKIREKLLRRGAVLAGATMVYAALMQDDETYKNATPEQKYGNWFIHVPGLDEAVKLPIPFEIGYIFKALPEALVNMMAKDEGGEEALAALKDIALKTVPGGSSYGIPQALKPMIEVVLGKSFYTGRDLESAYEQSLVPGKRARENTTDFARTVGDMFNVSPIKIDALIQGYTSSTGLALVQALSFAIPTPPSPDKAALRASEMPLVGSLFQPKDAGGVINAAYERMNEAKQVKTTFDGLMEKGRTEEARQFLQENLEQFANSGLATNFTSTMQKLSQAERAVRASNASPEAKRAQLDQIKQTKIKIAEAVRAASKTTPQASRP